MWIYGHITDVYAQILGHIYITEVLVDQKRSFPTSHGDGASVTEYARATG